MLPAKGRVARAAVCVWVFGGWALSRASSVVEAASLVVLRLSYMMQQSSGPPSRCTSNPLIIPFQVMRNSSFVTLPSLFTSAPAERTQQSRAGWRGKNVSRCAKKKGNNAAAPIATGESTGPNLVRRQCFA